MAKYEKSKSYNPSHWIFHKISPNVPDWSKTVKIITCICDPVRRLVSDFLHVKAEHVKGKWARPENAEYLGKNSNLYPISNISINTFVDIFVRKNNEHDTGNPMTISNMISDGKFRIKVLHFELQNY